MHADGGEVPAEAWLEEALHVAGQGRSAVGQVAGGRIQNAALGRDPRRRLAMHLLFATRAGAAQGGAGRRTGRSRRRRRPDRQGHAHDVAGHAVGLTFQGIVVGSHDELGEHADGAGSGRRRSGRGPLGLHTRAQGVPNGVHRGSGFTARRLGRPTGPLFIRRFLTALGRSEHPWSCYPCNCSRINSSTAAFAAIRPLSTAVEAAFGAGCERDAASRA